MSPVAGYIARRLVHMVPVLLGIIVVNFFLLQLAPGDMAEVLAGAAGTATPEYMAELRRQFGLDQPLLVQLARYLGNVATLDLGFSFYHGMAVADLIGQRLVPTLLLMGTSLALAVAAGVLLGVLAARRAGGLVDAVISAAAALAYATPLFWIGLMLIVLFAVKLEWLPTGGMSTIAAGYRGMAHVLDVARHLVLPAATLSLFYVAVYTRLTRASVIEVSRLEFVRTAVAKGAPGSRVVFRHVLRNALFPVVTMVGMQVGSLLGGAVLIETVFGWPGLGRLAFEAVLQRDYNLLLGILVAGSTLAVLANLAVDLLYAALDPRVRLA